MLNDGATLTVHDVLQMAACIGSRDKDRLQWLTIPLQLMAVDASLFTLCRPIRVSSSMSKCPDAMERKGIPRMTKHVLEVCTSRD